MNGSRVNPNATKDIFQDYDIINLVTDIEPFKDDQYIIPHFGETIIVQKPTQKLYDDCCDQFIFGIGSHMLKTLSETRPRITIE